LRCAEAARDARLLALELANRELTTGRTSDQAEILELRGLTTTFASALEQIKTSSSSDQDARLLALEKTVSDQPVQLRARLRALEKDLQQLKDNSDDIYNELDALKRARDKIYTELGELKFKDYGTADCRTEALERGLRGLWEHVRLPRDHGVPRLGKTIDELSARVDRIVMDMGSLWGDKWRSHHDEFQNYR
jgi:chromosome segregation ATPase